MTSFKRIWPDLASVFIKTRAERGAHTDGTHAHPIPAAAYSALERAYDKGSDIDQLLAMAKELAEADEPAPVKKPAPAKPKKGKAK